METTKVSLGIVQSATSGKEGVVLKGVLQALNETNRLLAQIGTLLEQQEIEEKADKSD